MKKLITRMLCVLLTLAMLVPMMGIMTNAKTFDNLWKGINPGIMHISISRTYSNATYNVVPGSVITFGPFVGSNSSTCFYTVGKDNKNITSLKVNQCTKIATLAPNVYILQVVMPDDGSAKFRISTNQMFYDSMLITVDDPFDANDWYAYAAAQGADVSFLKPEAYTGEYVNVFPYSADAFHGRYDISIVSGVLSFNEYPDERYRTGASIPVEEGDVIYFGGGVYQMYFYDAIKQDYLIVSNGNCIQISDEIDAYVVPKYATSVRFCAYDDDYETGKVFCTVNQPLTDAAYLKLINNGIGEAGVGYAPAADAQPITSEAEFLAMASNGNYYLANDLTLTESYSSPFSGIFDGCGYTVTIKDSPMFMDFNGEIKNLSITGSTSFDQYNAAIAERSTQGMSASNITNYATVRAYNYAGAIVGFVNATDKVSTFTNIVNHGNIYAREEVKAYCGGIVGRIYSGVFTNCVNNGNINGYYHVGGICGQIANSSGNYQADFYYCANNGAVGGIYWPGTAGGIVGYIGNKDNSTTHNLIGCVNTGDVVALTRGGGIVGFAYTNTDTRLNVRFCINTGKIDADYATGIVGYANGRYNIIAYNIDLGASSGYNYPRAFIYCSTWVAEHVAENYLLDYANYNYYSYSGNTAGNIILAADVEALGYIKPLDEAALKSGALASAINAAADAEDFGNDVACRFIQKGDMPVTAENYRWVIVSDRYYYLPIDAQFISIEKVENGSASVSVSAAYVGDTVTVDAKPAEGFYLASVEVTDAYGRPVDTVTNGDLVQFTMPETNVTVKPVFEYITVDSAYFQILGTTEIMQGGKIRSGMFTYELKDHNGNVIDTAVCDANGAFNFKTMVYNEEGYHLFVVSQKESGYTTVFGGKDRYVMVYVVNTGNGYYEAVVVLPENLNYINLK